MPLRRDDAPSPGSLDQLALAAVAAVATGLDLPPGCEKVPYSELLDGDRVLGATDGAPGWRVYQAAHERDRDRPGVDVIRLVSAPAESVAVAIPAGAVLVRWSDLREGDRIVTHVNGGPPQWVPFRPGMQPACGDIETLCIRGGSEPTADACSDQP